MHQYVFEKSLVIAGKRHEIMQQLRELNNSFSKLEEAINEMLIKIK